jgi:3-dehydroquinate synthase
VMQKVEVNLDERSYPIFIGTRTLDQIAVGLTAFIRSWSHSILICDANVELALGRAVESAFSQGGKRTSMMIVPSGEENKSIANLTQLWSQMLAEKTDRKSVVVAIGGGVVGDLAGFAAASFMRGLRFVQVPTTLLAMVDSSVGGKTGINLPTAKNMIGAFWQPHAVWIDSSTLDSLPDREFRSGLAEVVKYGVILDESFFEYLEQNADAILARSPEHIETIVRRSCELKAKVVSQDERETTGLRAVLNYGHTFGHAIEAKTAYGRFLHGEAISIGMTMAGQLSLRLELWPKECLERQTALLVKLGLPTGIQQLPPELPPEQLIDAMQSDKKTEHGKLNFILPTRMGNVRTVSNCEYHDILGAILGNAT